MPIFEYKCNDCNKKFDIIHPDIKRKYSNIFFSNRSYQEKIKEYQSVDNYFQQYFQQTDIAFISSRLVEKDIEESIARDNDSSDW